MHVQRILLTREKLIPTRRTDEYPDMYNTVPTPLAYLYITTRVEIHSDALRRPFRHTFFSTTDRYPARMADGSHAEMDLPYASTTTSFHKNDYA